MTPRKTTTKRAPAKKAAAAKKSTTRAPVKKAAAKKTDTRKRTTAKKPTARKTTPAKKTAKKTPARRPRKKSEPQRPNVDEVVDELKKKSPPGHTTEPPPPPPREPGDIEKACRRELEQLGLQETALGASAIALARMADASMDTPAAGATALREMRMALAAARGLGKPGSGDNGGGPSKDGGGEVVPETRLERMRREREQGARS